MGIGEVSSNVSGSVLDNTIVDPGTITTTGRYIVPTYTKSIIDNTKTSPTGITTIGTYIVPATGTSGAFVGKEGQYAVYNGATFTYSVPTNNDFVYITTGTNAGTASKYVSNAWTVTPAISGEFIGKEGKYADFDGTTFTYTTPSTNDTVLVTSGTNAGQVWKYISGAWTLSSQSTGLPTYNYDKTKSYNA